MPLMSIDQLKPAMVLAADVHSRTGRLLATQDTVITTQHLIAFRTWGVLEAAITTGTDDDAASDTSTPPDQSRVESALASLLPHFRLNDVTHPLVAELLRLAAVRKATWHEG